MKNLILIAEDESNIRSDIRKILEMNDFKILEAQNGKQALNLAKQHLPDLIISDLMMPEMDGLELLKELQVDSRTNSIPFLFLTAKTDRLDVRNGMKFGADDYITKPFLFSELLEAVRSRLTKKKNSELTFKKQVDEIRINIARSVPHEVRTPLNIIIGYTDFLYKSFDTTKKGEAKEILGHILNAAKRLNIMIDKYVLYSRLELIASNPHELKILRGKKCSSVDILLKETASSIANDYGRKDDLSIMAQDIPLQISNEHLLKIIEEITDNSFKYSEKKSIVKISTLIDDDCFYMEFYDEGRGLTPDQIKQIGAFNQFDRIIYEQQGTGMGLGIVSKILEIYDGNIDIESNPGIFTKVKISLPQAN